MEDFAFYFIFGWQHIMSFSALDHLLFIITLSAVYLLQNWQQVLILVTAFTLGHSLTLALSVYRIFSINDQWVEFFIPLTIVATALFNLGQRNFNKKTFRLNYVLALFFGLVHGLGFASTIRFMLAQGEGIAGPLLSFNLGLEAGQIIVVGIILLLSYLFVNLSGLKRQWWVWGLSSISLFIATFLCIQNKPF
jgi:hypothetical protein